MMNLEEFKIIGLYPIIEIIDQIINKEWTTEDILKQTKETEWFKSKYFEYLPFELQVEMHMANEVDIKGAIEFLENHKVRVID